MSMTDAAPPPAKPTRRPKEPLGIDGMPDKGGCLKFNQDPVGRHRGGGPPAEPSEAVRVCNHLL